MTGITVLNAEDRAALDDLIRRADQHEGAFGEFVTENRDGTLCLPWSRNVPVVDETVQFLIAKQLLISGFDWPGWEAGIATVQGGDPAALANCTAQECAQYLTLLVRAERFADGTLARSFENGLMQTLLRRVSQLSQ
jgi:hypothetical protein